MNEREHNPAAMPFRKPVNLAMVSSMEDDEADDEDHYPIPASAQDVKKNRGEPAESPDSLSGMAAMKLRDSYEEDGGPGGKRGRGCDGRCRPHGG